MSGAGAAATREVVATIAYTADNGETLVNETFVAGGVARLNSGTYERHAVTVRDARAGLRPRLDREGFELVAHATAVRDFHDPRQITEIYHPEVVALVRARTGAARVVVFDHTLRTGDEAERTRLGQREVIHAAHNDYTEWSGPQRVRDLLPGEAEALLARRFAIVQVWRGIDATVESNPLALADARSVAAADLLVAERRFPGRVGQTYRVKHNPAHRWHYFPRMRRDEAIVFKVYDSMRDGRARFTPHTSFDDPTTPTGASPRRSIEVRTFAFF
jgi:hypothetical protein